MIYTSNFFKVKNNPRGLAICRSQPKWWRGDIKIELAPATWEMVRMKDWEIFTQLYAIQVKKLDVHEMAKLCEGRILLCWENIEKEHCHRELIRKWFVKNGYECEEYVPEIKLDKLLKKVETVIKKPNQLGFF